MCNLESSKSVMIDEETQNAFDYLDGSDTAQRFVELLTSEGGNRKSLRLQGTEELLVQEMIEELDGRTWDEVEDECHGELSFKHHDMVKPICFCKHITRIYTKYLDKWLEKMNAPDENKKPELRLVRCGDE